jgi:hypothetical protein
MALVFRRSAARHGISAARAQFVVDHGQRRLYPPELQTDDEDFVLFLGLDRGGVPLEVVGIELEGGDVVVIHVMVMRRRYRSTFMEVT